MRSRDFPDANPVKLWRQAESLSFYTLALLFILGYGSTMKLSEWARQQGISYKTAWKMFHAGALPVSAEQLSTGTIVVQAMSYSATLDAALRLPKDDRRRLVEELEKSL